MRLIAMALLVACTGGDTNLNSSDTDPVDETGWDNYGDADTDSDTDSDTDPGDTDTDPQVEEWTACQASMSNTSPAYPVFPAWDGVHPYVNFSVTLTGATREWATLSWASENSEEGWYISCAQIIDGTTAVIRVEANSTYGASTFGNTDPGDGSSMDHNGYYWYPWSVTGGDLGGTPYTKMVDGETVNLVAVEEPAQ